MAVETKEKRRLITIEDLRKLHPCYDPIKFAPEDWSGSLLQILERKDIPAEDRLWVALREDFIHPSTLRHFAVWCDRQALALVENPDPRRVEACNVAERYANGEATDQELDAARDAARDAAWYAAWYAARDAAWYAAWYAARDAAWYAARDAARDAARYAARDAAWYAARYAAREKQVDHLIEMLKESGEY